MSKPDHILIGVTGGIAAYKSAQLVRDCRRHGADVRVVMTQAATAFVTPLTFQALCGHRVHTTLLDADAEAGMGHIELARWADLFLIAPLSADCAARLASGQANDLLSTVFLATPAPVMVAPAMNQQMWAHPAVQANMAKLRDYGVHVAGPEAGDQACGDVGAGRMCEADVLADAAVAYLAARRQSGPCLQGRRVVVTAGPTREAIDPVRYLSNRSSGRMGFAVAEAAAAAGAEVVLVAGPCALPTPVGVERVDVNSAEQMHQAVMAKSQDADLFFAVAAVADYRSATQADSKIKKSAPSMSLEFTRNADILADVAALEGGPRCIGFAAETNDLAKYAMAKLERKGLDLIAANAVGGARCAFDAVDNALHLFYRDGRDEQLGPEDKRHLAAALVARAAGLLDEGQA